MKLVLISDTFPPMRTSGAVQMQDLTRELARQGHDVTVLLPSPDILAPWSLHSFGEAKVLRLKSPRTKDVRYFRRTLGEWYMPYAMRRNMYRCPLRDEKWDGVIWYSPSIFHGPFVNMIKRRSRCKGYLIVRDIFPDWALDLGLMKRGLAFHLLKQVARQQYNAADIIGVQTSGNLSYFTNWQSGGSGRKLEVLQNWLGAAGDTPNPIRIDESSLAGRKVFVYAGNMGVAQGMDIFLDLAERFRSRPDVGFLFVGRGSDATRLRLSAAKRCLDNVLFHDEIAPDQIPDLYAQCRVGVVALDRRHKSHNIPGKFLTYMQCGLPVIAVVNPENDLVSIIRQECVGEVCGTGDVGELLGLSENLLRQVEADPALPMRCKSLFERQFSAFRAAHQIVSALQCD